MSIQHVGRYTGGMVREPAPEFALRLRGIREARGLNQSQLSELARTGQAVIAHLEKGDRQPSLELAWRLACALGVTVGHLLPERSLTPEGRKALAAFLRARPPTSP